MTKLYSDAPTIQEYRANPTIEKRNRLIMYYMYLVVKVASALKLRYDLMDLIQDGVFGLIDAIEKYDSEKATSFNTYAQYRIRGAIIDAARKRDWIPRQVRKRGDYIPNVVSLDFKIPETDISLKYFIDDGSNNYFSDFWEVISVGLKPKEVHILKLYFVEGETMLRIGEVLGVSQSAISLRLKSILERLSKNEHLREHYHVQPSKGDRPIEEGSGKRNRTRLSGKNCDFIRRGQRSKEKATAGC